MGKVVKSANLDEPKFFIEGDTMGCKVEHRNGEGVGAFGSFAGHGSMMGRCQLGLCHSAEDLVTGSPGSQIHIVLLNGA